MEVTSREKSMKRPPRKHLQANLDICQQRQYGKIQMFFTRESCKLDMLREPNFQKVISALEHAACAGL
jgi:hypothetical protein